MLRPFGPEFIIDGNDPAVADLIKKYCEIKRAAASVRSHLDDEVQAGS
jgi:hypothetical protein